MSDDGGRYPTAREWDERNADERCHKCDGEKKVKKSTEKKRCPKCDGYGEYKQRNFFMPSTWNECFVCNGNGFIEEEEVTCDRCGGTGKEPERDRRKF